MAPAGAGVPTPEHVVKGGWLGFLLHSECSLGKPPEGQQGVGWGRCSSYPSVGLGFPQLSALWFFFQEVHPSE